jgi:hypothetical protein
MCNLRFRPSRASIARMGMRTSVRSPSLSASSRDSCVSMYTPGVQRVLHPRHPSPACTSRPSAPAGLDALMSHASPPLPWEVMESDQCTEDDNIQVNHQPIIGSHSVINHRSTIISQSVITDLLRAHARGGAPAHPAPWACFASCSPGSPWKVHIRSGSSTPVVSVAPPPLPSLDHKPG